MVNEQAMLDTLAAIELDPQHWNQQTWSWRPNAATCNTTFCMAGHAVKTRYPQAVFDYRVNGARPDTGPGRAAIAVQIDGEKFGVEDLAMKILDLDERQADRLFWYGVTNENGDEWDPEVDGEVTVEGLREVIKKIIDEDKEAR